MEDRVDKQHSDLLNDLYTLVYIAAKTDLVRKESRSAESEIATRLLKLISHTRSGRITIAIDGIEISHTDIATLIVAVE